MHILEAAIAANIAGRPLSRSTRHVDPEAITPPLGARCLARALAAIGAFALFIAILDMAA